MLRDKSQVVIGTIQSGLKVSKAIVCTRQQK